MRIKEMLKDMNHYHLSGDPDREISGICYDSRQVKPGHLFVAVRGNKQDGHRYIEDALARGATAVVGEETGSLRADPLRADTVVIRVDNSRQALARLAAAFYGHPYRELGLVGITGTSGKTTTAYVVESILRAAGAVPGVIGTINYRFQGKIYPAPMTTPESLDLMRLLREMADNGVTDVIMEVSSHALDQGRIGDCAFRAAVFTNLSREHLDYHPDMEEYFRAKSLLFCSLSPGDPAGGPYAVINIDDPQGESLARLTRAALITYGLKREALVRAEAVQLNRGGLQATIVTPAREFRIKSSLIGEINLYNVLAAAAVTWALGIDPSPIARGIEALQGVPGRLEPVENDRGLSLIVDYAHKPDALLKVLRTLRPLANGRLITVFGCGGDRDRGKRCEMGLIAGENSDLVFVTSDNPRSEDPVEIIEQIEQGLCRSGLSKREWPPRPEDSENQRSEIRGQESDIERPPRPEDLKQGYFIEVDRRRAIRKAVTLARAGDLILIAGKGHEDYQIIGHERRVFDDRIEAARAAAEKG